MTTLSFTRRARRLALLAAAVAAVAGIGSAAPLHSPAGPAAAAAAGGPCGSMAGQPASIKHVVVIMDENQSYNAIMGSSAAPNLNTYASQCGVATRYWAITHPSHSDYIATVAGDTHVPPGCSSWTCVSVPLDFCGGSTGSNGTETCPNVFSQIDSAGKTWKVYGESMPSNCSTSAASPYSAGHNPPVWFVQGTGQWNISASCKANDVPLESSTVGLQHDITNNSLPAYSWIVPNKCDDMHNCTGQNPVTAGDNFVKTWVDRIIQTPDYQNGNTIIFITWDEGVEGGRPFNEDCLSGSGLTDESCHVPLIVLSPYIQAGSKPSAFYTHYGLLRATEQLLGITTYLGHAGDPGVNDLLAGFGIQLGGGGGGDTQAPNPPTGLQVTATTQTSIGLSWTAATDNVGVTRYRIYRDGSAVATIGATTTFTDTGLSPGTQHAYTVTALDAAGNESGASNAVQASTDPGTATTVFSDDFESGTMGKWTTVKGGMAVQAHDVFAGGFAAESQTTGTAQYAYTDFGSQSDVTLDIRFKVISKASTTIDLAKLKTAANGTLLQISLTGSTDKLRIRNAVASTTVTAGTTASTGVWHELVVHLGIAGASGHTDISLDGTPVAALTKTWNTGSTAIGRLQLGDATAKRTSAVAFDNVVLHT